MLDIKFIRENSDKVKENCQKRGIEVDVDKLLDLDKKRREILQKIEGLRAERKRIEEIEKLKKIKEELKQIENGFKAIEKEFRDLMLRMPNMVLDEVPEGKDEKDNVVIKEEGDRPKFDFKPKDYLEIAEKLDLIDIKRAVKVSGSRFGYLKKDAALLEFALINLAFNVLNKEGFVPIIPPVMISKKSMQGMGFPWQEVYYLPEDEICLVGTAEHSIGPMHMNEIITNLPKRYIAFSTCFRREAGTWGKDTKGILRAHQFDKVEMFSFCHPDKSKQEHQFLVSMQEKLMQCLKLPYRVVQLCTGELGIAAANTYDIETWLPSQGKYRETHSCSNCTDFQARRLNIRYQPGKFVHTLNGTALAIGRTLIAIIENYQKKDGSIEIPKALKGYINVKTIG